MRPKTGLFSSVLALGIESRIKSPCLASCSVTEKHLRQPGPVYGRTLSKKSKRTLNLNQRRNSTRLGSLTG